jgi:hypothetical protein
MYSVLRKSIAREQAGNMDRLRRLVESETARELDAI